MPKILVVDDEKLLRDALGKGLSAHGWEVEEASDGEAGLKKATSLHPDLILLDIMMPGMDGIAVLKRLREDEWGKNAKVIFLTNMEDDKKVEEVESLGALGYFVKSDWKIEDLAELIKESL